MPTWPGHEKQTGWSAISAISSRESHPRHYFAAYRWSQTIHYLTSPQHFRQADPVGCYAVFWIGESPNSLPNRIHTRATAYNRPFYLPTLNGTRRFAIHKNSLVTNRLRIIDSSSLSRPHENHMTFAKSIKQIARSDFTDKLHLNNQVTIVLSYIPRLYDLTVNINIWNHQNSHSLHLWYSFVDSKIVER